MARIVGILNLHNDPSLGQLTKEQPVGSTSFLGRYALMDFALSNFANSGINVIQILNPYYSDSIRSHVRDGNIWINNTKIGFLRLFINEEKMNDIYFNTDINNIIANVKTLKKIGCDYVVIANSHFLYSMDFNDAIEYLEKNDADIVSIYKDVNENLEEYFDGVEYELKGKKVTKANVYSSKAPGHVSLDTYIMKANVLPELVDAAHAKSQASTIRSAINDAINEATHKIVGYKFDGYVVPVLSFNHYVRESMKLLDYKNRKQLFVEDWPILTTTHNTPPALYQANADVKNSFIANGCIIKGTVKNSILSRDVIVEEGAVVENCILFTNTVIGKNVKIKNVVANKAVKIRNIEKLEGTDDNFVYIKREEVI